MIAITGSSGFVARNLRQILSSSVVCFSRRKIRTRPNESLVQTDYVDISPNLKECDTLVHLVGFGRQSLHSRYADAIDVLDNVINSCKKAHVKRMVFLSGLGVSPKNTSDYFLSKYEAELRVRQSGLDYVVFRPSFIIGKDDHLTLSLQRQAKGGAITIPGTGKYAVQPIHISDAVRIIKMSLTGPACRVYDLVGPVQTTFERLVRRLGYDNITKVPLQTCMQKALNDPRAAYGLDDLNILVGGFTGDYAKLSRRFGPVSHV